MILLSLALSLALQGSPAASAAAPVELGRVAWGRDLDAGFRSSRESGRPVLLFFQEVPG